MGSERNGHPIGPNGFASAPRFNEPARDDVEIISNTKAEAGVIAAILMDPSRLDLDMVKSLEPDKFFREVHQLVFGIIIGLHREGLPIDAVAVSDRLESRGWSSTRALELLDEILGSVAHSENCSYHATIVAEKAELRQLREDAQRTLRDIERGVDSVEDIAGRSLDRITRLHDRLEYAGLARGEFKLELVDSRNFLNRPYKLEWLVQNLLVKLQTAGIAGPLKSLKTSILIELIICLSSACDFLGRFAVPRAVRSALFSGESGRQAIQRVALDVCLARDLDPADCGALWGFELPQLTDRQHLSVLRKVIRDNGLEVVGLDPFYLMISGGKVDPASMFQMGPLLRDVAETCLGEGCTPVIAHHFTKSRVDPFAPPELSELAFAGMSQFLRQWLLLAPRERFDPETGKFSLHLSYGGSSGHSGLLALDVEVGRMTSDGQGRTWKTTILSGHEMRDERAEAKRAEAEARADEREKLKQERVDRDLAEAIALAVEAFRGEPRQAATVRRIRTLCNWQATKAENVTAVMERRGLLRPTFVTVKMGNNRSQDYPGYQLVEGHESFL